jgi:glycosyltransferase involved in cell wall biosynthesis
VKNKDIQLSVVVASWNGTDALAKCLESLEQQTDKSGLEVIVVSNFESDLPQHESVVFYIRPRSYTVPELRRDGIAAARGNAIALIEDHCVVDPAWSSEIKKAHNSGYSVVGGSVENLVAGNSLDWAVYFYDYGKFMLPNLPGAAKSLSGFNVSYKREVLDEIQDVYVDGFFEAFANAELESRGSEFLMMPTAIVYHNKSYKLKTELLHCYHLARTFAAQRAARASGQRLFFVLGSLALPVLLPTRVVLSVIKKGRNLGRLVTSVPYLILLMSFWSFGEFCGYLAGEGTSRGAWR